MAYSLSMFIFILFRGTIFLLGTWLEIVFTNLNSFDYWAFILAVELFIQKVMKFIYAIC
jgi:hypothetical protein